MPPLDPDAAHTTIIEFNQRVNNGQGLHWDEQLDLASAFAALDAAARAGDLPAAWKR